MRRALAALLLLILAAVPVWSAPMWAKGNTHAHTTNSDGNLPPDQAAAWYKSHGYQFVFITDHDRRTDPATCAGLVDESFIVLPGEELNTNAGRHPVHACALGISTQVKSGQGAGATAILQAHIDNTLAAGGICQINHPNWRDGLEYREILPTHGASLIELLNTGCDDFGNYARPSTERLWDMLLSAGMRLYGAATDDTHNYSLARGIEGSPGNGWVYVRVNALTQEQVVDGLRRGDFYASNGVELRDVSFVGRTYRVTIAPVEGETYRTQFFGLHGQLLADVDGPRAFYRLTGSPAETYVRAKVISSSGAVAWCQPVWPAQ